MEIFEPKSDNEVPNGTVTRAKAFCPCCSNSTALTVLPPERVRAQLSIQRGGADVIFDEKGNRIGGSRLLAVVTLKLGEQGRYYRLPYQNDYEAILKAQKRVKEIFAEWERGGHKGICPVPDEPLPPIGALGFRVQRYGMLQWGDLFTARQKVALHTFSTQIRCSIPELLLSNAEVITLALGKLADLSNSICRWEPVAECPRNVLGAGRIKAAWEIAEGVPLSDSSGSFLPCIENSVKGIESISNVHFHSGPQIADAIQHPLSDESAALLFTDPPYYDAIPYADLSDFFLVWMKRTLPGHPLLQDPFDSSNSLSPKDREAVQDETKKVNGRPKDRVFFEETMAKAFAEGRRILHVDGVGSVIFAHKTTEGWEALLSGMIKGKLTIPGSWPIATEASNRLRARDSAALATSVHLVCRPRTEERTGDWGEVLRELPGRVGDWMERLQSEGVRGADLVFACIGPALEIFSRYSRVETAEGREVKLPEFLEKVWEVVGRIALEQVLGTAEAKARNGLAGALEEDARLTALFLWTIQSTNGEVKSQKEKGKNGEVEEEAEIEDDEEEKPKKKKPGFSLIFDVVRRFAQPLGIHLPDWEGRIIETEKGVVRLLSIQERAKALFGEDGAQAVADRLESSRGASPQLMLFPQARKDAPLPIKGRKKKPSADVSDEALRTQRGATTLDRVHAAMLLQANGRANALRALLKDEQEHGPDFLRLANALSALYPKDSEEKRLLDAMLLAMPR